MLRTVKAIYDKGKVIFKEDPKIDKKMDVIVTFLSDTEVENSKKMRTPGSLKGKLSIPDDFNEPLDDLKDYMQ
jgi:hypothetical protein